jgi:hypothetical protein
MSSNVGVIAAGKPCCRDADDSVHGCVRMWCVMYVSGGYIVLSTTKSYDVCIMYHVLRASAASSAA